MEVSGGVNTAPPPRRISAKKAVAAFAEQFSGSDSGGSGDELGSAKWKGRVSSKPKLGKKASGRKRSASVKETTSKAGGPRSKKNTGDTPSTGTVAVASSSAELPVQISRPRPRPKPIKPGVKAVIPAPVPHQQVNDDGNYDALSSDLTSLSPSESEQRSPSPEIIFVGDIHPRTSTSRSQPNPPHAISLATSKSSKKARNEPLWSLSGLGTYVWVLIEPKSWRVFDENEDGEDGKERLWWPGKITSSKITEIPLQVKLFRAGAQDAGIPNPCSGNILSQCGRDFQFRFQTPTFVIAKPFSELDDITASPKKKQKRDRGGIERRWEDALKEMRMDKGELMDDPETSGDEDLPVVVNMFQHLTAPAPASSPSQSISVPLKLNDRTGTTNGTRKRRRRSSTSDDGRRIAEDEEDLWEPPPRDDGMDIPGELVLARDKAATTVCYWPGQLLAYIPPTTRKQQAKYTIMWLDGTTQDIPRSWFYAMEDDGFAVCKLGQFTSEVMEVQNDEDDDDDSNDVSQRSPSPIPRSPPPSTEDFLELSIREQFVYTKPILKAVLMHEYEPVYDRHRRFMNGGKQRESIVSEAGLRGKMDPKDVEMLQTYIKEWCLREDLRVVEDSVHVGAGEFRIPDEDFVAIERQATPVLAGNADADVQRHLSPPMTETMAPSSPPAIPPSSSLPSSTIGRESSVLSNTPSFPSLTQASTSGLDSLSVAETEPPMTIDDINDNTSDLTNMDDEHSVAESRPTEIPPRQRGCDDFESLPPVTKIKYCSDILLLEAIRQILLWRTGARTSSELQSPEEERRLFEKGQELLQERDWVFDIMRLRNAKQSMLKNRAPKERKAPGRTVSGGRARKQVNYAE